MVMRGSYLLLIELTTDATITIGKSGVVTFSKGFYVYVGSALSGLEQRVHRHLRMKKKRHWHIDYLLQHANIIDVFYKESTTRDECTLARTFEEKFRSVPGFGCSDCSCRSHLFYGTKQELLTVIEKVQMVPFTLEANT